MDAIIQELINDSFRIGDIDEICKISRKTREVVFNELALELANRFQKGTLSYQDADWAMNCVWNFMIKDAMEQGEGFSLAQPAFEIYEAFDEGEYDHRDGSDPVEKYTKPQIKEILSRA
jgi:hypothetical protein